MSTMCIIFTSLSREIVNDMNKKIALCELGAYMSLQMIGRPGAIPELVRPEAREAKVLLRCQKMRTDQPKGVLP